MEERAEDLDLSDRVDRRGRQEITVTGISIFAPHDSLQTLVTGRPAEFTFELSDTQRGVTLSFVLYDQLGNPVTTVSSENPSPDDIWEPQDQPQFECTVPDLPLVPGRYRLDYTLRSGGHVQDQIEGAAFFDVSEGLVNGRAVSSIGVVGNLALPVRWRGPVSAAL
jgi:lipopolysaccharide transport system ATP-binding protein